MKHKRISMYKYEIEAAKNGIFQKNSYSGYKDPLFRAMSIPDVIDVNLTKTQKSYIMLYYTENKTIPEIARLYGVNKSTVSRTIRRGAHNLRKAFGSRAS